jgi:hypothetical protein
VANREAARLPDSTIRRGYRFAAFAASTVTTSIACANALALANVQPAAAIMSSGADFLLFMAFVSEWMAPARKLS